MKLKSIQSIISNDSYMQYLGMDDKFYGLV